MKEQIKEILSQLRSCGHKKFNECSSLDATDFRKRIKRFVNRICINKDLYFDDKRFNLKGNNNYCDNDILCRVYGNKKLKDRLFLIIIYFKPNKLEVGVNIDRDGIRLGAKAESIKDLAFKDEIRNEVNRISKEKDINYDNEYQLEEENPSDEAIECFIYGRLNTLLPIYNRMCEEGFWSDHGEVTIQPRNYPKLNLEDFKVFNITNLYSSVNKKDNSTDDDSGKQTKSNVDPRKKVKEDLEKSIRGKRGEQLINDMLKDYLAKHKIKYYKWVSSNSDVPKYRDDSKGYDFEITESNNTKTYLEVKTTQTMKNIFPIFLSSNQCEKISEILTKPNSQYLIVIVVTKGKKKGIYKFDAKEIKSKYLVPINFTYNIDLNKSEIK